MDECARARRAGQHAGLAGADLVGDADRGPLPGRALRHARGGRLDVATRGRRAGGARAHARPGRRPRPSARERHHAHGVRGQPRYHARPSWAPCTTRRGPAPPWRPSSGRPALRTSGIEVVFFGSDVGTETIRDIEVEQHFARSMTVEDAMQAGVLLAYEVNGEPLPVGNGFPLRLIAARLVRRREREVAHADRGPGHPLHGQVHGPRLRDAAPGRTGRGRRLGRDIGRPDEHQLGAREGGAHRHGLPDPRGGVGQAARACRRPDRRRALAGSGPRRGTGRPAHVDLLAPRLGRDAGRRTP